MATREQKRWASEIKKKILSHYRLKDIVEFHLDNSDLYISFKGCNLNDHELLDILEYIEDNEFKIGIFELNGKSFFGFKVSKFDLDDPWND